MWNCQREYDGLDRSNWSKSSDVIVLKDEVCFKNQRYVSQASPTSATIFIRIPLSSVELRYIPLLTRTFRAAWVRRRKDWDWQQMIAGLNPGPGSAQRRPWVCWKLKNSENTHTNLCLLTNTVYVCFKRPRYQLLILHAVRRVDYRLADTHSPMFRERQKSDRINGSVPNFPSPARSNQIIVHLTWGLNSISLYYCNYPLLFWCFSLFFFFFFVPSTWQRSTVLWRRRHKMTLMGFSYFGSSH